MMGLDRVVDLKWLGPQVERAVLALETIATAAEAMGAAAKSQQEMIQRALDASAESGGHPHLAVVSEMRAPDPKPKGKK